MKFIKNERFKAWLFPVLLLLWPWCFLILWIPPLNIIFPFVSQMGDSFWILDKGIFFCYAVLLGGVALNGQNAIRCSKNQEFRALRTSFLILRIASIVTYLALLWGLLLSFLYLMGPDRNKHIFILMLLSLIAVNLSGTFYAMPLITQLKREQEIQTSTASSLTVLEFIIGLDIVAAFILYNKSKILLDTERY